MYSILTQQYFLKYIYGYYTGALDGKRGVKHVAAIKKFQKGFGLTADGAWGNKTNAKAVAVVKELQTLLNKFGAGLKVDGAMGPKTIKAIGVFQKAKGLTADCVAGTKTWAKLRGSTSTSPATATNTGNGSSAHFAKSEFRCKCGKCNGYPAGTTNAKLLTILEGLRSHYGKPVTITSGQRCKSYNSSLKGSASNSAHLYGKAADFYIPGICDTSSGRSQVRAYAYKLGAKYSYCNTSGMGNAVHVNV